METYTQGDKVRLGAQGMDTRETAACRFEVRRPDGTGVQRDWDNGTFTVRATQPGIWTWRMYFRTEQQTDIRHGQFEVLPGNRSSDRRVSWIARALRRWTQ